MWEQLTNLSTEQDELPFCVSVTCGKNIYFTVGHFNLWDICRTSYVVSNKTSLEFLKIEIMSC